MMFLIASIFSISNVPSPPGEVSAQTANPAKDPATQNSNSMNTTSNASSPSFTYNNGTFSSNSDLAINATIGSTYFFNSAALENATLKIRLEHGIVDQLVDQVYNLAKGSYNVNLTAELRNEENNSSAVLTGVQLIKKVLDSQVEDTVGTVATDKRTNNTTVISDNLTNFKINVNVALTCILPKPHFEVCKAVVTLGKPEQLPKS